jgi:hypothetical protein
MLELNFYPYFQPIVLTDDIYESYAGNDLFGQTTTNQRKAAYRLAEIKATEDIGTFLTLTTISGTYPFSYIVQLDHTYVHQVLLTRFIDFEEDIYWVVTGTSNEYINLFHQERGLVDVAQAISNCHCHSASREVPYKLQIVYTAGLPSGTVYQPDILLGLCTYAKLILNEMVGYGNEAPGDIGVQSYKNQEYSENRVPLGNSVYGNSAQANFAHKMLSRLRIYRQVSL